MATISGVKREDVRKENPLFSRFRVTIETPFYGNNVVNVTSLKEAYKLAKNSPGTIVTDLEIFEPEKLGLDPGSKVLLFNDGAVYGRAAAARRILGQKGVNPDKYASLLREAVYNTRYRNLYHAQAFVGLHEDFIVRAHILIPEGYENLLYNWLLNFQPVTETYIEMYRRSRIFENEGDIFVFSDPDWSDPEHPLGLSFFDTEHNCAALLGMRYFGEFKKGTLTLAWSIASRNGYVACHGGQKRYNLPDGRKFVVGVFGLSGSGKSTITHAHHGDKYDVTILHDDAFIISLEDGSSVALEPSYFDKTADYPLTSPDNKYLLSVQNVGATLDDKGRVVIVTEDIRNGNGRAIKSRLWSPNRVDKFDEPVSAIIWLMKDNSLPPVLKVTNPILASAMGATLATKRTSAERLPPGVDMNALVFEPYANPFRTYPLSHDYYGFKELFESRNVACYIFNTGYFLDKKVTKELTLSLLESIIEGSAKFKKWGKFSDFEILEVEGFIPDFSDKDYKDLLEKRIKDRINFVISKESERGGFDKLPPEVLESLEKLIVELE
ncbi:phosphoenolpyruvate carboxykinase (ATP) [Kosmotoga sp. DU53]|uniref:phosphoenolpyruvate carboxykinase (ATP) n=1 Tax=Kosmotoga sp. DU53 TaxID=1310160 RepID=UPI0007C44F7F|nr:phosphoenolpyruvate carboxykinase (ATP) [Kosmotoga sp. DU53]OAA22107.1 phosphoenolpyruvate carboxykinase [Kosmotoga sp. DU53]